MRKAGIAGLLLCLMLCVGNVYAQEPKLVITEAHFYTGTLYYCDAERNRLVLQNVTPTGERNLKNTQTAQDAEYTELPIFGLVTFKDGTAVSLADCNYYPDSEVRVLITRSSDGTLGVIQMKFL